MKSSLATIFSPVLFSIALIFCTAFLIAMPAHAARNNFEMHEKRSSNLKPFPKWTTMVERFVTQKEIPDDQCDKVQYHPCALIEWRTLVTSLEGKSLREQLKEINTWGNDHPYVIDQINWGMEDYWDTPYEFMSINGDCEDYAIAKYYSLRALGYTDEQMRIMIVQDFNLGGIIHAILAVRDEDNEVFILDNQIPQVMPAAKIYHYRPIYGINESAWWVFTPKT